MQNLFSLSAGDLKDVFIQSAFKLGIGLPNIIEKDCWLVKTLETLFSDPIFMKHHVFKGGTSLSKCYNLIHRFSEDVDITISKNHLGFEASLSELFLLSNKKRKLYFDKLNAAGKQHVHNLCLSLNQKFNHELCHDDWKLYISPKDPQTIIFEYPRSLDLKTYPGDSYIKPRILLEFGCRGETYPCKKVHITTYAEQSFPDIFSKNTITVNALTPERTFWEKITLLHMLANQDENKPLQPRMARHYYDIYQLNTSSKISSTLKDNLLLKSVAAHKSIFFKSRQASYETAKHGTLKLTPSPRLLAALKADYDAMSEMFFTSIIPFNEIMLNLSQLEDTLNYIEPAIS